MHWNLGTVAMAWRGSSRSAVAFTALHDPRLAGRPSGFSSIMGALGGSDDDDQ